MRIRLILSYALIVLVAVGSVVLLAREGAAGEIRLMFQGGRSGTEGLVGKLKEYYEDSESWEDVDELLEDHHPGQGFGRGATAGRNSTQVTEFRLADTTGKVIADTTGTLLGLQLTQAELVQAIPLMEDSETVGYLLPVGGTGYSPGDETQLVSGITRAALIAGLIAGGLSLLLALWLAYQLLRPVHALTRAAESLAQGDLSQRVIVSGDDELAVLGRTFNQMATSLENAEQTRRALTADIAHELRNPLAVQRAHLEALQDGIYPLSSENLAPILEQNQLLSRLVDDLRTLALAEAGQLELVFTSTDCIALAKRLVDRLSPQAEMRGIELTVHSTPGCPEIETDPGRMAQLLGNLLSNALRYTPDNGTIQINIHCTGNQLSLSVHDNGPGIPDNALPHVFERFYRADKSRSRQEGGTGLGLAIARQIAHAHGGELIAANSPHGGAVFTLTLPVVKKSIKLSKVSDANPQ